MLLNPSSKRILCYGDSNTWGTKPDRSGRFPVDQRWTGVLQKLLGSEFDVIEEGLGGRTVNLDQLDRPGRNGKAYFTPCLQSHFPLDMVIIMLGTNDLKKYFTSTTETIIGGLRGLIDDVRLNVDDKHEKMPKILILSPAIIDPTAPRFQEFYGAHYDPSSGDKSRKLAPAVKMLCESEGVDCLDAAKFAEAGEDGLHLSLESHQKFAQAVYAKVKAIFS